MTVPAQREIPGIVSIMPRAVGREAGWSMAAVEMAHQHSRDSVLQAWRGTLSSQARGYAIDRSAPGWDGYDAVPISRTAVATAARVIDMLPDNVEVPEIVPESSGGFSLDWSKGDGMIFSVTASFPYMVYAGVFGNEESPHGKVRVADEFPSTISSILTKYFKKV